MNEIAAAAKQQSTPDDLLFFNGLDLTSGDYLLPPMAPADVSRWARGERFDPQHLSELKWRYSQATEGHYGVKEGVDPKKLEETGWGVIFACDADPAIREALSELLTHRQKQATQKKEKRYKEYSGPDGYQPDESKTDFLGRHGAGPGAVDPDNVPYYLLIVSDPETIPFSFQYQLDVQYGVGRIHFDTLDEYAHYAHSVVAAETNSAPLPRRAVFFATANPDDRATNMSCQQLAVPLAELMKTSEPNWQIETVLGDDARKARLNQLLSGGDSPALLFTASHGGGFPNGHPLQLKNQGCLICQDWPGPKQWQETMPPDFYFAGDDIADSASIPGMITFHFACFGAGTPRLADYIQAGASQPEELAPRAFISHLPQRLLGHPNGGALAAIGHVERAWSYSFKWAQAGTQLATFQSTLARLMEGHPVGSATEFFNGRYAELASDLTAYLNAIQLGKVLDDRKLSGMWTSNNDARSYSVIGDPAVRLKFDPA